MRPTILVLFSALLAACGPQRVTLGGRGSIQVSPEALDFGRVRSGTNHDLDLTITNTSAVGVTLVGTLVDDDRHAFSLGSGGVSLAPGTSLQVSVRFTAAMTAGLDDATLELSTGENTTPVKVALSGEVVQTSGGLDQCGDGVIGATETCDPPGSCLTACADDANACTRDVLSGTAATCDVVCEHRPITTCLSGDGCCPSGCARATDSDCSDCGNGRLDFGEVCDGASCPTTCPAPNACTRATLVGSAAACTARCETSPITQCANGDGCCPAGCARATDDDCGVCGDGRCDGVETCSSCVQDCGTATPTGAITATCSSGAFSLYRPPLTCSPDIVVLGVYQPTDTPATIDPIVVTIRRTTPMILVLSSYGEARWDVVAAVPGVQVTKLIVSGFAQQQVSLVGPGWTQTDLVHRNPVGGTPGWLDCGYEWPGNTMPGSCRSTNLVTLAEQLAGSKVSAFAGCYEASAFTVD